MITPKTKDEINIITEGGKKLASVKNKLRDLVRAGSTPLEVDRNAEELLLKAGGKPSFKTVQNYFWSTCINVNEGVVHGIPTETPFKKGDVVSIDVGLFYKGFHTDTSFSVLVDDNDKDNEKFLDAGQAALAGAISEVKPGNRIGKVSKAMQKILEKRGYSPIRALTGHGIGKTLHEPPQIPCFWEGDIENSQEIPEGAVLAVEVIYALGLPDLVLSQGDDWTIATQDGKIAALFEETVIATVQGPLVVTA